MDLLNYGNLPNSDIYLCLSDTSIVEVYGSTNVSSNLKSILIGKTMVHTIMYITWECFMRIP